MKAAKCPRCGADMTNGVCDNCGFPFVGSRRKTVVKQNDHHEWEMQYLPA